MVKKMISFIIFLTLSYGFHGEILNFNKDDSVRFHVFTNRNQSVSFDLKNTTLTLNKICNSSSKPMYKFLVHGFAERWNMNWRWDWVGSMIKELNNSIDAPHLCIIAVDWAELSKGGIVVANYWKAIQNMNIVAEIMVNYLNKSRINETKMHCIGFSLGAHMCSIFYKTYYAKLKVKPERITGRFTFCSSTPFSGYDFLKVPHVKFISFCEKGLDPAGPFYKSKPFTEKLHYTDANFVDIIHSSDNFGLTEKSGHMDFYPDLGPSEYNVFFLCLNSSVFIYSLVFLIFFLA
jgi:hypothetical protein